MRPVEKVFSSIQGRLLAVFFISTLLTIAIVFAFNQWLRLQLIAEADNALLVNAVQIADRIDEFNRSNQQVFSVGSRLPDLVDFLEADDARRSDPDFQERTRITLDSLEVEPWDEYYILSQAILDEHGRNILDTARENMGADESQEEYFSRRFYRQLDQYLFRPVSAGSQRNLLLLRGSPPGDRYAEFRYRRSPHSNDHCQHSEHRV